MELAARGRSLVEGSEFVLTAQDFAEICAVMMQEAGISLSEGKANLVYSRLAKRVRRLGLRDFAEYCALVRAEGGAEERQAMIAALTTNVTRFFREPHHFEHLKTKILPPFLHRAKLGQKLRIWSSACSSGQEPYSIGLTILSLMPDAAKHDIKILATDIDPHMLAAGEAGVYEDNLLEPVPAELRQRWFEPAERGHMRAGPDLRAMISFRKLNLINPWPMRGIFQAIFCRNVVIYFENDTQEKIWARMVPLLDPDGALYIGHSERVSGSAEPVLRSDGITIYRPVAAARRGA